MEYFERSLLVCRFRTVVKWFVSVRPCPCRPTPPTLRGLGCSMPFGSAGLLRSPPPYTPIRTRRCRRLALTVRKQAGYGYSKPFGSARVMLSSPPPYTPTSTTSPLLPLCLGGSSYTAHAYYQGPVQATTVTPRVQKGATPEVRPSCVR